MVSFDVIAVFTDENLNFRGNPAACILLEKPLSEGRMQQIAKKLQQPATSFIWQQAENRVFEIRWFAPDEEIGLCGHGTAATAVYLGNRLKSHMPIRLKYRSGEILVKWNRDHTFEIKLDAIPITEEIKVPDAIESGLGVPVLAMLKTANKHLILTDSEDSVRKMVPDFTKLRQSEIFGYAITAQGDRVDFVSRTLVPHVQQLEDHATGSSHAFLAPYWADRIGKTKMKAYQLSPRGALFELEMEEEKVKLTGKYEILESSYLTI